jgi:hypothetical protein
LVQEIWAARALRRVVAANRHVDDAERASDREARAQMVTA